MPNKLQNHSEINGERLKAWTKLLTFIVSGNDLAPNIHLSLTHIWVTSLQWVTLKRKCRHFDEIFITGCTGSCHFDNFQCSQWWKFHQNEDISVSVYSKVSWHLSGGVVFQSIDVRGLPLSIKLDRVQGHVYLCAIIISYINCYALGRGESYSLRWWMQFSGWP